MMDNLDLEFMVAQSMMSLDDETLAQAAIGFTRNNMNLMPSAVAMLLLELARRLERTSHEL